MDNRRKPFIRKISFKIIGNGRNHFVKQLYSLGLLPKKHRITPNSYKFELPIKLYLLRKDNKGSLWVTTGNVDTDEFLRGLMRSKLYREHIYQARRDKRKND